MMGRIWSPGIYTKDLVLIESLCSGSSSYFLPLVWEWQNPSLQRLSPRVYCKFQGYQLLLNAFVLISPFNFSILVFLFLQSSALNLYFIHSYFLQYLSDDFITLCSQSSKTPSCCVDCKPLTLFLGRYYICCL